MECTLSRRAFLLSSGAGSLAVAGGEGVAVALAPKLAVVGLLVDGLQNPLGLHNLRSRLSWQLASSEPGIVQSAYRVGVASSREKAERGSFDLWDSGRITSDHSVDIPYGGAPMSSRQRGWWRVAVWTASGGSASSDVAFWEMGLLSPSDWTGEWVAAEDSAERSDREAGLLWIGEPSDENDSSRSFRLFFDLPARAEVTLLVARTGDAAMWVDGKSVDLPRLDPNAWAGPQPARLGVSLDAGRHQLLMSVKGKNAPPRAAVLVRADLPDGTVRYFGDGTVETRSGWAAEKDSRKGAQGWTPVKVDPANRAPMPPSAAYLLRRPFTIRGEVASARLYVTALGLYEAELNGVKVGDALLTPEFSDYRKTLLYAVHDVGAALRQGENVLGAIVGEGWYGSRISPHGRYAFGPGPIRCFAQLEILFVDGRRQIVQGDQDWMLARAPITACGIYDGETYDARQELSGWSSPGFALGPQWQSAKTASAPAATCKLLGAVVPPIRRSAELRAQKIGVLANGPTIVDFGQNFAGWVKLRVKGKAGQKVTLRHAELLNADGSIDQSNLRGALACDTYILRGDPAGEIFEPRFTYHGFRYVEIDGLAGPLDSKDVTGIVIRSDLTETGKLSLASYIPQRLWQNGLWSQRSNFMGIPTDCPQRDERLGWMGDAGVFWDAAAYNMDVAAFTNRFMTDVADAQRADGGYSDIAPDTSDGTRPSNGSSPGWADAGITLPWTVWWRYGDTAIIDQHWDSMSRFMASIKQGNPDFLWRNVRGSDYADWLALDAKEPGDPTTPKDLVATAMWKAAADSMAQMAAASNREEEARAYRALSKELERAFGAAFIGSNGVLGNGSQTGYILALHFGLVPESLRAAAAQNLVADIRRRGTLLSTGFLGTPYSLDVLAKAGEVSLVYDLLLRQDFPSWGYMIAKQATTVWERWNSDAGDRSMNSFNHYALGAVAGFMWRRIAGIDATAPGFARFRFDPVYDPRLKTGGGQYQSRMGLISTRWEFADADIFRLKISVPANSQAEVVLPTRDLANIRQNGKALSARSAVERVTGGFELRLQSGDHEFQVQRPQLS